jgi:hypothetical protein
LASGGARGATSSSIAVFDMLLKRYFLRCIVRALLQLRNVFSLFASILYFDADCDAHNGFDMCTNMLDNHDQLMIMMVILS